MSRTRWGKAGHRLTAEEATVRDHQAIARRNAEVRAKLASPGSWGWYGGVEHLPYMKPASSRLRRRCDYCPGPARPRVTHVGMANGVEVKIGCEWHIRQWVRQGERCGTDTHPARLTATAASKRNSDGPQAP